MTHPTAEVPAAAATPRDRQRDALRAMLDLAGELDRLDEAHHTGRFVRQAWIDRRDQRASARIAAREAVCRDAHAAQDAARIALKQQQQDQLAAFEQEAGERLRQATARARKELQQIDQDEQNALTAASKLLEDTQAQCDQWLKQLRAAADQWQAQVAQLREQRKGRLTTFPKALLRRDTAEPSVPAAIHTPTDEPSARQQVGQWLDRSVAAVHRLHNLTLPHALFGIEPYYWGAIGLGLGGGGGYLLKTMLPGWEVTAVAAILDGVAGGAVLALIAAVIAFFVARQQVRSSRRESLAALSGTDAAVKHYRQVIESISDRRLSDARVTRDQRKREFVETYAHLRRQATGTGEAELAKLNAAIDRRRERMLANLAETLTRFEQQSLARIEHQAARLVLRRKVAGAILARERDKLQGIFDRAQQALIERWTTQRDRLLAVLEEVAAPIAATQPSWTDPFWATWQPPIAPSPVTRVGLFAAGLPQLLPQRVGRFDLGLPADWRIPAVLAGPSQRNLLIQTTPAGRAAALDALRAVMLRLLTSFPAGQVKFTLIDPVGLGQSFAGFMHLADHDETLVNTRIWTEPAQIDEKLGDLTDHLSYVIQKHLRNQFETIDDYNRQAGQLAEPYRFVVVADYPHRLSVESVQRLGALAAGGSRCGVFVLAVQDLFEKLPAGAADHLARHASVIRQEESSHGSPRFVWLDEVYQRLPLELEASPDEASANRLIARVGEAAVDVGRVRLPFATIAPPPADLWSLVSAEELSVAIGKAGAARIHRIVFGQGVAQHALVAGKTGSGKSSLLHAVITNLALWYSPRELELYLIDFKKGVEFKPYVTHALPHARAIAIESDRGFGLSILRRLDRQMDERGELFRHAGVQSLAAYRAARPADTLPRTLLVIDEFQELFSQDDEIALSAATLLDRLVRQGRAFGMHALLGSQSLSGAAGLAMGTMSQMAIRIALMCGEADSQLILSDDNTAARLLTRPGEAIYNAQGGAPTANVLFQVAWLPDDEHRRQLQTIARTDASRTDAPRTDAPARPPCVVFEGSQPADLARNPLLRRAMQTPPDADRIAHAYVGEPIAMEEPASFEWLRTGGANGLIVAQQAESALAVVAASMLSLAAQHRVGEAEFIVVNGSPQPEHAAAFEQLVQSLPHAVSLSTARQAGEAMASLHARLQSRLADTATRPAPIYVVVFALHRLRELRKSEETFSFAADGDEGAEKPARPDRLFGELLHEGPAVGMHTIVWCDRVVSLEQALDRRDLRAFDQRLLFQMSANDSATLIDSPQAGQIGPFRALLCREDRGTIQPIRPYGPPSPAWLGTFAQQLRQRQSDGGGGVR